jgi:hypothetical protein
MGGVYSTYGTDEKCIYVYKLSSRKPEGTLGRPNLIWEDNIKTHLRQIGFKIKDWISLTWGSVQWWDHVNAAMNLRVL